jgi:hypothetical protein
MNTRKHIENVVRTAFNDICDNLDLTEDALTPRRPQWQALRLQIVNLAEETYRADHAWD